MGIHVCMELMIKKRIEKALNAQRKEELVVDLHQVSQIARLEFEDILQGIGPEWDDYWVVEVKKTVG